MTSLLLASALCAAVSAGCVGSVLEVRHADPARGPMAVFVDGEREGHLEPGDALSVTAVRGAHVLVLEPTIGPAQEARVMLDRRVVLTVVPRVDGLGAPPVRTLPAAPSAAEPEPTPAAVAGPEEGSP